MTKREQSNEPNLVARYPYRDAAGTLLFEVLRYHPKGFEIRGPRGAVLDTIPPECVLYRLPELLQAESGETVYVCEGEKDVDNLRQHGLVATTNPGGTRRGWRCAYSEFLRGRHVVILPDADGPGQRHADAVAAALAEATRSVIVLELPGLRGPADVSDWLARGNTVQRLLALTARARYARVGLSGPPRGPQRLELIFTADLDPTTKLVLLAMLHRSRHDGARHIDVTDITASALASLTGVHRVTAQRTVARLRDTGVLRRDLESSGHMIAWEILAAIDSGA